MANRPPPVTPAFSKVASGKSAPSQPKEHPPAKKREAPSFELRPPGMSGKAIPPPEPQRRENLQERVDLSNNKLKQIFNGKAR